MDPEHVTTIYQAAKNDKSRGPTFSFEYYPPKTPAGVEALYKRFWRMCQQKPLFADVTWGAGGSTSDLTLELTSNAKNMFSFEMNMHITCTNMPKEKVEIGLRKAKENGLKNIMCLRGDPPIGEAKWKALDGGFTCALDLIKYVKKEYGNYFGISCAGYPEGHPLAITKVEEAELETLSPTEKHRLVQSNGEYKVCRDKKFAKEIAYLKKKVDAGAEFIVTQLFYDVEAFAAFIKTCREAGITVPILPGIMPITTYAGFQKMISFCKTRVPEKLSASMEKCKDFKEAFKALGLEYVSNMCQKILDDGLSSHLHFYCLNKELAVYSIMQRLGWPVKLQKELAGDEMNAAYAKVDDLMAKAEREKEEKKKIKEQKKKLEEEKKKLEEEKKKLEKTKQKLFKSQVSNFQVSSLKMENELKFMDSEQLSVWFENMGLAKVAENIKNEKITGDDFADFEENDYAQIGIPISGFKWKQFNTRLKKLKNNGFKEEKKQESQMENAYDNIPKPQRKQISEENIVDIDDLNEDDRDIIKVLLKNKKNTMQMIAKKIGHSEKLIQAYINSDIKAEKEKEEKKKIEEQKKKLEEEKKKLEEEKKKLEKTKKKFFLKFDIQEGQKLWNLNNRRITDEDCLILSRILKINCTVVGLGLHYNDIEDAGATAIADALKKNSSLQHLFIYGNKFTNLGKNILRESRKNNTVLRELYIENKWKVE